MLARRGYSVKVFDRLSQPESPNSPEWSKSLGEKNYNIGINGRGQKTLKHLGVMDRVDLYATDVVGRMDWAPDTPLDNPEISLKKRCVDIHIQIWTFIYILI